MIVKSLDQPKMQAILASLVEGVIIFDLDGRVIVANHVVERIFRTARGTMVGKTMEGISPNSDELVAMVDEALSGGKETFTETALGSHNQVYRVLVRPLKDEQGNLEGTVVVFHDITDIRNFAQVRSEFAGNVSHELRTPLTSIKGAAHPLDIDQGLCRDPFGRGHGQSRYLPAFPDHHRQRDRTFEQIDRGSVDPAFHRIQGKDDPA